MAGKSLRAQLNQIRAWVREGRTDAWIAHQLEVPASELRDFRRRHGLSADSDSDAASDDLRDEIEAEVEAATAAEEEDQEEESDDEGDSSDEDAGEPEGDADKDSDDSDDGDRPKRRRRRRGGRGRGRRRKLEATFDHGDKDGYGLWLDAAVKDNPVYKEHWAGHRDVEVSFEADTIVIRRSGSQDGD